MKVKITFRIDAKVLSAAMQNLPRDVETINVSHSNGSGGYELGTFLRTIVEQLKK